ncbi:polysaccharide biosynthesis protein [Bacteroides salyersiae]|jgi:putative nucleotide-diphosphate sugar epimerase|nr:nucleoside-diphosphate sugar epimerase/dehydratase [Bacteroides salyersiae]MBV4204725.1 polysaccharide biosynthesis protein [Bacteroides salyersiae]MCB6650082.1 polysaccharide biosynthesis protein [Bacteroides salyersiae]MCS3057663.1 polysaccharide biosynthesis protein [Bacteroides salyersiae]
MKDRLLKLFFWYFSKGALPYWFILFVDSFMVVVAGLFAQVLHVGFYGTLANLFGTMLSLCCYLLPYLIGFRIMHTYSSVIRYSSFVDLCRVAMANLIGVIIVFCIRHFTPIDQILVPLSWQILFTSFIVATAGMWGIRILVKYIYDMYFVSASAQKVFIYGVKEGGIALAKSIHSQESQFIVAGFVSDDSKDWQHILMGTKIYPNNENLVGKMRQKGATILMVSPLKTESLRNNHQMIDSLAEAGIKIMVYSSQEWDGKSDLRHMQLKEIDIEDLLPRNQIEVNLDAIAEILTGKCVLITGAAGSIGSEIVRQVAAFKPSQLVLIDQAETPLHDIRLMMMRKFSDIPALTLTASIGHKLHMETVFKKYNPDYVFHAAAYKHVPMMEDNPGEAVINNIEGTRIIADLAVKYGVQKFVMVSTDKAVNPTNVMGCSKRICEMYCQSLNKAIVDGKVKGCTQFVTTRFGNVLGSNGSVIPIFKEQIKNGGPITVTHPDIIRYFMLIPEACRLVLQAGSMGNGGEIFVFDMGKPVKIADLATRMILLSGAQDVQIKYTGLRDGEKLYEELLNQEESTKLSLHPKIKLATVRELGYEEVSTQISKLVEITKYGYNDMDIVRQMKILVPEFKSKHSKYETLD